MSDEDTIPETSSSMQDHDEDSPPNKKIKVISSLNPTKKLEERLNHILSCSVCLDLPASACMQCCHGHLMCVGCYNHLLADSRLKDEQATCPTCRVDIGRGSCVRNLAVEKTISELPVQCSSCSQTFARCNIAVHENQQCLERKVLCRFNQLGCQWSGPFHELQDHVDKCAHPKKTPTELLKCLVSINHQHKAQVQAFRSLSSLLSFDHISYIDIQLRSYRTDDFVTKLFYESNRFHLLGQTWAIKAFVSAVEQHPSNPTVSADRRLSYQVLLKSKITEPVEVETMILRAPYEEVPITPTPSHTKFTSDVTESDVINLAVDDINRLLGSKVLNFRVFMFQHDRKQ